MQVRVPSPEEDTWYGTWALRCVVIGLVAFAGVAIMLINGTLGYAFLCAAIGTIFFAIGYLFQGARSGNNGAPKSMATEMSLTEVEELKREHENRWPKHRWPPAG